MCSSDLTHTPAIAGFDVATGAAPDYWTVLGTGKSQGITCVNDYKVTISTSGGNAGAACYRLTVTTDKRVDSAFVTGSGSATINQECNFCTNYSNNTNIQFRIEKVCNLPVQEAVNYTVTFHL